jgi:glycosyltransferase involved in cell wall biosynthesis
MLIDLVVPGLDVAAGGPTRTVVQLSDALAECSEAEVRLISQARIGADILLPKRGSVNSCVARTKNAVSLKLGLPGRQSLHSAHVLMRPQILHSNGIWNVLNHWSTDIAFRHGIPLVIQPRGMLEPWALRWRGTKKRLALALYQRRDLELAALLVATSEQEADNFRRFGLHQPIAVIPNGVDLHGGQLVAVTGGVKETTRQDMVRNALFLSRVHPIKGLVNLLMTWATINPRHWMLQIAGPHEGGHLREVLALAEQLGINDKVQYLGELDDMKKWTVYRHADLFVLPTFSENFGVVVAEALSQGLPVITTTGTPWEDLRTFGCGWWVEPSEAGLRDALSEAFALPARRLVEMGERGRAYVQRYDWSVIAGQMLDAYRWVLGQGPLPDCIRLD